MSFEIKKIHDPKFFKENCMQHTPIMWHMRMKQKQKKKREASGCL